MRLFVALPLPVELRVSIEQKISAVCANVRGVRWVAGELLHCTLMFLGEQSPDCVATVAECMRESVCGQVPSPITVKGVGVFPHRGMPRVLWVGLDDPNQCTQHVYEKLSASLTKRSISFDAKPFLPHVTVGRVKVRTPDLRGALIKNIIEQETVVFGSFVAERIVLYASELLPTGPRYTVLEEVIFE